MFRLLFQDFLRLPFTGEALVANLHFVKEPLWIALQNRCEVFANVSAWLAESVDDPAQMGFIDAEHSRQAILPNPSGVNSQLQIRIDLSIDAQCPTLQCVWTSAGY